VQQRCTSPRIITNSRFSAQTEEAKHEANKNTGSGESLGDKASHVGNVASNKVNFLGYADGVVGLLLHSLELYVCNYIVLSEMVVHCGIVGVAAKCILSRCCHAGL